MMNGGEKGLHHPVYFSLQMHIILLFLQGVIVMERHYAFNWIIGANGGADWDDIQPNT